MAACQHGCGLTDRPHFPAISLSCDCPGSTGLLDDVVSKRGRRNRGFTRIEKIAALPGMLCGGCGVERPCRLPGLRWRVGGSYGTRLDRFAAAICGPPGHSAAAASCCGRGDYAALRWATGPVRRRLRFSWPYCARRSRGSRYRHPWLAKHLREAFCLCRYEWPERDRRQSCRRAPWDRSSH